MAEASRAFPVSVGARSEDATSGAPAKAFVFELFSEENSRQALPASRQAARLRVCARIVALAQGVNTVGCGNEHEVHTDMESNCTTKDLARFFIENPKSPKWRSSDFCIGKHWSSRMFKGASQQIA